MLRPTQNKVKQAVFNIFQAQIPGSEFLDLFAGKGTVGLEALNRGAKQVVLVENNPPCRGDPCGRPNKDRAGARPAPTFIKQDVFLAIKNLYEQGKKFDFIFADPPYHENLYQKILTWLTKYDILKKSGFLILEHYWREVLPENVGAGSKPALILWQRKRYGDTVLEIYVKNCSLPGEL